MSSSTHPSRSWFGICPSGQVSQEWTATVSYVVQTPWASVLAHSRAELVAAYWSGGHGGGSRANASSQVSAFRASSWRLASLAYRYSESVAPMMHSPPPFISSNPRRVPPNGLTHRRRNESLPDRYIRRAASRIWSRPLFHPPAGTRNSPAGSAPAGPPLRGRRGS